ncbi:tRNA (adenine-N6)-methyltransferase [Chelonobacter oris]|uniref:tRNA1(Val) (adenine(37)-N6)-methyltransferase n=1 Tax=Chelonobacter oris TaxID=505317 RepID=A0A0A3ALX5_9PAST|nr:methyltransferase [Chelonobacter oris]KGQ70336.1 tRNA (adenine-N6)-methyltransferase [Chelonobacter oris]
MQPFQFKQFSVAHDRCAMKVGTDSILLGAWANIAQVRSVLDMGCGSGLLALMLAQRLAENNTNYRIAALEIDPAAAQQAQRNSRNSPWADKIDVVNQDLADYVLQARAHFDLIIANPPYFAQGVGCRNPERQTARYLGAAQGHLLWLSAAQDLLNSAGKIAFVLPYAAGENLLAQLDQTALYCTKKTAVITKHGKAAQRLLLEFGLIESEVAVDEIVVYQADNRYHPDFIALTRAFYLKF